MHCKAFFGDKMQTCPFFSLGRPLNCTSRHYRPALHSSRLHRASYFGWYTLKSGRDYFYLSNEYIERLWQHEARPCTFSRSSTRFLNLFMKWKGSSLSGLYWTSPKIKIPNIKTFFEMLSLSSAFIFWCSSRIVPNHKQIFNNNARQWKYCYYFFKLQMLNMWSGQSFI